MIKGLKCEACMKNVPWDQVETHFGSCKSAPLPIVMLLVENHKRDVRHTIPRITTTTLLTCPREIILRHSCNVYESVGGSIARTIGTVMHAKVGEVGKRLQDFTTENCTCPPPYPIPVEHVDPKANMFNDGLRIKYGGMNIVQCDGMFHVAMCDKLQCTFSGEIEGIHISGQVDAIEAVATDTIVIHDWKFRSSWRARDQAASSEDICQMNINRILAEQNNWTVAGMAIGHVPWSTVKNFNDIPEVDWDTIKDYKPYPGKLGEPTTIGENLHLLHKAFQDLKSGVSPQTVIANLPKTGSEMFKSSPSKNKCTQYCSYIMECTLDGNV